MNQIQRNLYKALCRKCRFIDKNPALKNVFMLPPSHLFSPQQKSVDEIKSTRSNKNVTTNFINDLNHGGEYFSPKFQQSMTSILYNTFNQGQSENTQTMFDGLKTLNNAEEFTPYVSDNSYRKHQIRVAANIINKPRLEAPKVLETMDKLDSAALLRGGMGFVQHPFSLDFDVDERQKIFETKKVMIGVKADLSPSKDVTILLTMNKPLIDKMSDYHDKDNPTIPSIFFTSDAFYGGRNMMAYNTLTVNPNCRGIPLLNGNLFLNPDKDKAEKLVKKGDAMAGDFRFVVGFEAVYDDHLQNIMQRNKYVAVNLETFGDDQLLMDTLWNNEQLVKKKYVKNDLWERVVGLMGDEYAQSWLKWNEDVFDSEAFNELCRCHYENVNTQFKESNKLLEHYVM